MNILSVNKSKSHLDVILSNMGECFRGNVACPTSISDHFIIATNLIPRGVKLRKLATYVKTRKFQEIDSDVLDNIYDAKDIWTDVLGFDKKTCKLRIDKTKERA